MARKFPIAKPLNRRQTQTKDPKPIIIVVCEGKVTEPQYFDDFKKIHSNSLVQIKSFGGCGVPISVVNRAISEKLVVEQEAKKSQDSFERIFQIWAVFDRDDISKADIQHAFELANANGVQIAYSNPCFEVWGLMHYGCYSKPGHQHETHRALKRVLTGYCHDANPVLNVRALNPAYANAVANAQRALIRREEEGTQHGDPSTTVFMLTEQIRLFGRKASTAAALDVA